MKSSRSSIVIRRAPHQERARVTFDAILDAAVRVLAKKGIEGLNTNDVAAEAGVSIGSLYQYFSNKEELLRRLTDRHFETSKATITSALSKFAGDSFEVMVPGMLAVILRMQGDERDFLRVMREQLPLNHPLNRLHQVLDFVTSLVTMTLAARQTELGLADPAQAAFLLVHAVDGIFEAALRKTPVGIDEEALVREASELVLRYLEGARRAA